MIAENKPLKYNQKITRKFKTGQLAEIDSKQIEMLASKFWNNTEIATFIGCSARTLTNRFSNYLIIGRELGKGRLRDWQLKAAQSGNVVMLIWLGKQYLNQSDKQELTGKDGKDIVTDVKITIVK